MKKLEFFDSWNDMVGGDAVTATYGKSYDYTKDNDADNTGGTISSGVASYEPQIGGDESPFRIPCTYEAQQGSHFLPNDPVILYQESPVGETLYPSPVVGYSKITVSSVHSAEGRSAQGIDIHEFYTARDFPMQINAPAKDEIEDKNHWGFTHQERYYRVAQGYSFTFNDMHGKLKKVEHRVVKPQGGASELISYQLYKYNTSNGILDNNVPVMAYNDATGKIEKHNAPLGIEADVTIDTREKREVTSNDQFYANLNTSIIFCAPVPIFLPIPWESEYTNQFNSVVATKVIQQYGILKEVENFQEGAVTKVTNEAFDPFTGKALITSVNNEYRDAEFNVTYPAYWGYKLMGPSYINTGYKEHFQSALIMNSFGSAVNSGMELPVTSATCRNYRLGDELLITYTRANNQRYTDNVWVMNFRGFNVNGAWTCLPIVAPRFNYDPIFVGGETITNIDIQIVRSGCKNQLNENIQNYTSTLQPFSGYQLQQNLSSLVELNAKEFSDVYTPGLGRGDSLNVYVSGAKGQYRLYKEWAYLKSRDYTGSGVRQTGLFNATSLWQLRAPIPLTANNCDGSSNLYSSGDVLMLNGSYMAAQPQSDNSWVAARTITKWSPYGYEIENKSATGDTTTALYGYNNQSPVAIAQNARQGELLSDGFEDYRMLQTFNSWIRLNFSPFRQFFGLSQITNSPYGLYNLTGSASSPSIVKNIAHTGYYSLQTPVSGTNGFFSFPVPVSGAITNAPAVRYLPFTLLPGKTYIVSYWMKPTSALPSQNIMNYTLPTSIVAGSSAVPKAKSNIIDGWQQVECTVMVPAGTTAITLQLPLATYIDDLRVFPVGGNMKAFVYHPVSGKVIATLDENNYATFFEYDQEGSLIRTKKETERGIMTISESRSANKAAN